MQTSSSPIPKLLVCLFGSALVGGCTGPPKPTGFLSDYSRLRSEDGDMRYVDQAELSNVSAFVVEPVQVRFSQEAKGRYTDRASLGRLTAYMHYAVVSALSAPYRVVTAPGPGIARIRLAITDVQKDRPTLTRLGLGSVSMEGEVLDSLSGKQIAAVIMKRTGDIPPPHNDPGSWRNAEAVMDNWAGRFRERLDAVHGSAKE